MKAVLFDFNGTLFDDSDFHRRAWHDYMLEKFHLEYSRAEIDRHFIGPGTAEILRYCLGENLSMEMVCAYAREKETYYRKIASEKEENMRLIDGAEEMLDMLAAKGIPFVLATASMRDNVEFYLNDLNLKRWFTPDRVDYDTGELKCKPEPDFYLEAARRIHMPPKDCVIVEDSPTGFEAAKRAGAGKIIAIDRTHPREALESRPEIDAIIHDYWNFERFLA